MEPMFKYNLYDRINTPLVNNGIITMLGVDDGGTCYYVKSSVEGVEDTWWYESRISTP